LLYLIYGVCLILLVLFISLIIGYGASSKPPGSESHVEYSKREMAEDAVQVMYVELHESSD